MDRYRKKEIGVIFQKYNLINSLNCFENVDINKNENIDKDDIYNMFNKMKLSKKIKSKISIFYYSHNFINFADSNM